MKCTGAMNEIKNNTVDNGNLTKSNFKRERGRPRKRDCNSIDLPLNSDLETEPFSGWRSKSVDGRSKSVEPRKRGRPAKIKSVKACTSEEDSDENGESRSKSISSHRSERLLSNPKSTDSEIDESRSRRSRSKSVSRPKRRCSVRSNLSLDSNSASEKGGDSRRNKSLSKNGTNTKESEIRLKRRGRPPKNSYPNDNSSLESANSEEEISIRKKSKQSNDRSWSSTSKSLDEQKRKERLLRESKRLSSDLLYGKTKDHRRSHRSRSRIRARSRSKNRLKRDSSSHSDEKNNSIDSGEQITKKNRLSEKPQPRIIGEKDIFCWQCHRDGSSMLTCHVCPRAYHKRCAKIDTEPETWVCIECNSGMKAASVHERSEAMKSLSQDQFNQLLKFVMERINSHEGADHFKYPVDLVEYPTYRDFVVHPMDISALEKNINNSKYLSTESFIADLKWLLHNSYVFNTVYSELTSYARGIIKIAKQETEEIENCPNCYFHYHTMEDDTWFIEPCKKPHIIVWAKLRGFPHWPAKVMKTVDDMVDVRFFGDHNRAWLNPESCYLFSKSPPFLTKTGNQRGYDECIKEIFIHIKKLKDKYEIFNFFSARVRYKPSEHNRMLLKMLPLLGKYNKKLFESIQCNQPSINSTVNEKIQSPNKTCQFTTTQSESFNNDLQKQKHFNFSPLKIISNDLINQNKPNNCSSRNTTGEKTSQVTANVNNNKNQISGVKEKMPTKLAQVRQNRSTSLEVLEKSPVKIVTVIPQSKESEVFQDEMSNKSPSKNSFVKTVNRSFDSPMINAQEPESTDNTQTPKQLPISSIENESRPSDTNSVSLTKINDEGARHCSNQSLNTPSVIVDKNINSADPVTSNTLPGKIMSNVKNKWDEEGVNSEKENVSKEVTAIKPEQNVFDDLGNKDTEITQNSSLSREPRVILTKINYSDDCIIGGTDNPVNIQCIKKSKSVEQLFDGSEGTESSDETCVASTESDNIQANITEKCHGSESSRKGEEGLNIALQEDSVPSKQVKEKIGKMETAAPSIRLKVKSSAELLSSEALKEHNSKENLKISDHSTEDEILSSGKDYSSVESTVKDNVAGSSSCSPEVINLCDDESADSAMMNNVNSSIEKVINGEITVSLSSFLSQRKIPKLSPQPKPSMPIEVNTESDESDGEILETNAYLEEEEQDEDFDSADINPGLDDEIASTNIVDTSAWCQEPFVDNVTILNSMNEIFSSIESADTVEECKNLMFKFKKLAFLQRTELKSCYKKMKTESEEICNILQLESEKLTVQKKEFARTIKKMKLTQWCSFCLKEANFYCCWGTSYCSQQCQLDDWEKHYAYCKQSDKNQQDDDRLRVANPTQSKNSLSSSVALSKLSSISNQSSSTQHKVASKGIHQKPQPKPKSQVQSSFNNKTGTTSTTFYDKSVCPTQLAPSIKKNTAVQSKQTNVGVNPLAKPSPKQSSVKAVSFPGQTGLTPIILQTNNGVFKLPSRNLVETKSGNNEESSIKPSRIVIRTKQLKGTGDLMQPCFFKIPVTGTNFVQIQTPVIRSMGKELPVRTGKNVMLVQSKKNLSTVETIPKSLSLAPQILPKSA